MHSSHFIIHYSNCSNISNISNINNKIPFLFNPTELQYAFHTSVIIVRLNKTVHILLYT